MTTTARTHGRDSSTAGQGRQRRGASNQLSTERHNTYDAFISYSHALDGKLAPALQDALQGFAKPWYRLRALRVFRDETHLSANPDLWRTVEQALEVSRYFILLASPAAAASPWVEMEVNYWLSHKPPERLLIGLTEGELAWNGDRAGLEPLPSSLRRVIRMEPRYVDLRWMRATEHASPGDPRWRAAVADLAAPIHGCSKDELIGQDIHLHRRALRLARATVVLITVLAVVAGFAAIFAVGQRDEARRQAATAESRYLALQAENSTGPLDRSLLLAQTAFSVQDTAEARAAILSTLQRAGQTARFIPTELGRSPKVAVNRDGTRVAFGDDNGAVSVWDARSWRRITLRPTEDGPVVKILFLSDGRIVSGHLFGEVNVWSPDGSLAHHWMNGNSSATGVDDIAIDPTETLLAVADEFPVAGDKAIVIRSLETGAVVEEVADDRGRSVSFGSTSLAYVSNHEARVHTPGRPADEDLFLHVCSNLLCSTTLAPDGQTVAVADENAVTIFDARSGEEIGRLEGHTGPITSVAFSNDGAQLATGSVDQTVRVWRLQDLSDSAPPCVGFGDAVRSVGFVGATVVAVSDNGTTQLCGTRPLGHLVRTLDRSGALPWDVAFARTDAPMAVAHEDGAVTLWDPRTATALGELVGNGTETSSVALSQDGATAAVGSKRGVTLWDVIHRTPRRVLTTDEGVHSVAFSPNGKLIAAAVSVGDRVLVWDADTGHEVADLKQDSMPGGVTFRGDGRLLVMEDKNQIVMWDLDHQSRAAVYRTASEWNMDIAVSSDQRWLAVGTHDHTVELWDLQSSRRVAVFTENATDVGEVAFSPDSSTLVSADANGQMFFWDVATRSRMGTLDAGAEILGAAFTPDGKSLTIVGEVGTQIYDVDPSSWHQKTCAIVGRNLTRTEWDQYVGGSWTYRAVCP